MRGVAEVTPGIVARRSLNFCAMLSAICCVEQKDWWNLFWSFVFSSSMNLLCFATIHGPTKL